MKIALFNVTPQRLKSEFITDFKKKKREYWIMGLVLIIMFVAAVFTGPMDGFSRFGLLGSGRQSETGHAQTVAPTSFVATFDGDPAAPQPLGGVAGKGFIPDFDIQVHSRDTDTWDNLETQTNVMHGTDCSAPPAVHTNNTYEGAIFNCKNHIMTAMAAQGYGLIVMTPDVMADFSNGPAVVQWDMSTDRMSSRDWPDVWITPFSENLTLPFDEGDVDLQGPPKDAIHISLSDSQNTWLVETVSNYNETEYSDRYNQPSIQDGIAPGTNQDAIRQTFKATITRNHIKVERLASSTATAATYFDGNVPDVGFSQGVVQYAHHIYNPTKDGAGEPATWHWDNLMVSPAQRFTIIHANQRHIFTDGSSYPFGNTITFDSPAPSSSFLRFSAAGKVSYSLNGGSTWQTAQKQGFVSHYEHMAPYFITVPEGTQNVVFKFSADNWYDCGYGCQASDFSIWSTNDPSTGVSTPTPTPTPIGTQPTNTPTPTPNLTPTPTLQPSATPTTAPNPTATPTPTVFNTPTPTPTTIALSTAGYTTVGASVDQGDSGYRNGTQIYSGAGGVTKTISVYVAAPVAASPYNKFQLAIYTDNNGLPAKLIAKTVSGILSANTWNSLPITATLSPNKLYWLMYNSNGNSYAVNNMVFDSAGSTIGSWAGPTGFGKWPSNFGFANIGSWRFSIYITYQ